MQWNQGLCGSFKWAHGVFPLTLNSAFQSIKWIYNWNLNDLEHKWTINVFCPVRTRLKRQAERDFFSCVYASSQMQHPDRHSGHLRSETELVLRRSRTSAASLSEHGSSTITPAEHGTACQQPSAYSFLSLFFAVVSFRQAPTAAYIPVPPPLFLLMREHCQKAAGTFKRNIFSSCTNTAKILLMIIGFPVNPLLLKKSNPTTTEAIKEH